MDQSAVDSYVSKASDDVVACRERGRHLFPSIRKHGITFTDVDRSGLLLRKLRCTCCRCAVRVEHWEARTAGRGRNRDVRYVLVAATMTYEDGPDGERYLGPQGEGRMGTKQVREALASAALAGQTLASVRREAAKKGKE